jgi:flagellar hook assembly protein FlgD
MTPTISPTFTPAPPTPTAEVPVVTNKNVFKPLEGGTLDISMKAPQAGKVTVRVYNIAGDLVRPLFEADVQEGLWFQANWDGRNGYGEWVASGVYFVSVKGAGIRVIRKVVVLK